MINFLAGVALGVFVSIYGAAGVAQVIDKGVESIKQVKVEK